MKRFLKVTVAVVGLMVAQAANGQATSPPALVVDGSADGQNNRLTVDPSKGQKVVITDSGDGRNNKIVVAPDPGGTVTINASGDGRNNKIVVEEAPGEHVVIRRSADGQNNKVVIEKVPGPTPGKPSTPQGPVRKPLNHSRK
jgi:hypothetical protein